MDKALEQYLNTVDRKLRPLPASERADIVREIKSAMQDMAADGLPPEGILDRLDRPDALARAYLSDLLDKPERGGWRRLLTILAFYSLAGLSGMVVIPVLSICGRPGTCWASKCPTPSYSWVPTRRRWRWGSSARWWPARCCSGWAAPAGGCLCATCGR